MKGLMVGNGSKDKELEYKCNWNYQSVYYSIPVKDAQEGCNIVTISINNN